MGRQIQKSERVLGSGNTVARSRYLTGSYEIFVEGDDLYASMLDEISRAQRHVFLETYIFRDDVVGQMFVAALSHAAERGIDVVLRVDAFGSFGAISNMTIQSLRKAGVVFHWSYVWNWRQPFQYNRRNHRKVLLIDDRAVFLGGYNIGDENSTAVMGSGRWRDTHIRLPGAFVEPMLAIIGQSKNARNVWCPDWRKSSFLIPNYGRKCRYRLRCVLRRAIDEARERIWITTPYFVVDRHTRKALKAAACRGIDVRLMVPGKSDVALVRWAAHVSYETLLRRKVKIYEFQDRILHAKTMLIDTDWSMIGSSNFDYRSFYVNDEVNFISDERELNSAFSEIFEDDMTYGAIILGSDWMQRSIFSRAAEFVGWITRKWL
tara:strand:+ start:6228 stop:7358 length:1131 start_codon:yes stop_codon:yes gene_type:complete